MLDLAKAINLSANSKPCDLATIVERVFRQIETSQRFTPFNQGRATTAKWLRQECLLDASLPFFHLLPWSELWDPLHRHSLTYGNDLHVADLGGVA